MIRLLILALLLIIAPVEGKAGDNAETFSVFLVRHAEKDPNPSDPSNPSISECGALRAETLAVILADANLQKIYSTDYERTLATARPIAATLSLEIEIYDPKELEEFARLLMGRQQNALVVGHSNTTGMLAGILATEEQEEFDEAIYDRLYQVVISGEQGWMTLLHQGFRCDS
jgi:broad specificity phosphatase PhoE